MHHAHLSPDSSAILNSDSDDTRGPSTGPRYRSTEAGRAEAGWAGAGWRGSRRVGAGWGAGVGWARTDWVGAGGVGTGIPLGRLVSTTSSTRTAPGLESGLLPLPHFGDCTQDGQPGSQPHSAIASRVAPQPCRRRPVRPLGEAGPARVAVVDEDASAPRCPGAGRWRARRCPTGRRWPPAAAARSRRARRRAAHPARRPPRRRPRPATAAESGEPDRDGAQLAGRAGPAAGCRSPRRWRSAGAGSDTTWLVTSTSPRKSPTGPAST